MSEWWFEVLELVPGSWWVGGRLVVGSWGCMLVVEVVAVMERTCSTATAEPLETS